MPISLAARLLEKEIFDLGNQKNKKWLIISLSRLKTNSGKNFGQLLIKEDSDRWWLEIAKKYLPLTKFLEI